MKLRRHIPPRNQSRRGIGSIEYVLIISVILLLALIMFRQGIDLIQAVYEMTCGWIAWPFL